MVKAWTGRRLKFMMAFLLVLPLPASSLRLMTDFVGVTSTSGLYSIVPKEPWVQAVSVSDHN